MKFTSTCLVVLSLLPSSQAFAPQTASRLKSTALNEHRDAGGWLGPAAATVAGWTLAAQMAFANPMAVSDQPVAPVQISDSSTMLVADKIETMDFSMPSYGSAYGGDTNSGAKSGSDIPSFNPFGSSSTEPAAPEKEDTNAADAAAKKAEEKAAAEQKKAEEKAAAEQKKAEEKAAAEAKKAEEEAKKAEKEARRQAELEKQKEAAERSRQKKAEEAAAKVESAAPDLSIPSFSAPEMPDIKVPDMPKFSMPKIDIPDAPEKPKVDAPKVPEFSAPKVSAPKIPEFSAPKMSMPSFEAPKSSSGYDFDVPSSKSFSAPDEDVEPQEVRDARAKEARSAFLAADSEAKEIERQAKALRDVANEKKKIAKQLKDDACKTRVGGKLLCVRPLGSGY